MSTDDQAEEMLPDVNDPNVKSVRVPLSLLEELANSNRGSIEERDAVGNLIEYIPIDDEGESPALPTAQQIAEALWRLDMDLPWTQNPQWQSQYLERGEVVLALLTGGAGS
jgi:hypothetical protein